MNLCELIKAAREESDDVAKPYLWSDAEWTRYANEAENEACRRARLITDSRTPEVAEVEVTAGEAAYDLDERVLFVRRVKPDSRSQPLGKVSYKALDSGVPGWEDETGDPRGYITDQDTGVLRLYPSPTAADTLKLTVIRMPLNCMKDSNDAPEIASRFHHSLIYWMLHRAYSKQDAETKNEQKAANNLALFEQEFGKKSGAIDETWIQNEHGYIPDEGIY
jgi:hypothetical protein